MRKQSLLMAALSSVMQGGFNPMPKSQRDRRSGWRRDVPIEKYRHEMIRSDPREIAAWNAKVKRRNRRFALSKGLA